MGKELFADENTEASVSEQLPLREDTADLSCFLKEIAEAFGMGYIPGLPPNDQSQTENYAESSSPSTSSS